MSKAKAGRKPRGFVIKDCGGAFVDWAEIDLDFPHLCKAKDCRRLAAWLTKAADWLEQREKK